MMEFELDADIEEVLEPAPLNNQPDLSLNQIDWVKSYIIPASI